MASITKITLKSGKTSYRVFIRLRTLKPISKQFKRKGDAVAFARKIEGDYSLAESFDKKAETEAKSKLNITLSDVINKYLSQYQKKDLSAIDRLNIWIAECGDIKFLSVDAKLIRQGLVKIKQDRDIEDCTLNRFKANLSSVFEFAKEEYETTHNPCREVKAKPENQGRIRFLSDDERGRLLKACKESSYDRLYLVTLLAITTGARRGELLALKWIDIDFKSRLASLHTSKNGKPRELPLTKDVIEELKKFQEVGNNFVFPSKDASQAMDFRGSWDTAVESADIEDFRFHDLRHTCASYLAQSNASLVQIAEILGHTTTTVTKRYAHLCVEHKKSLVDSVLSDVGL